MKMVQQETKMPDELRRKLELRTGLQKKYAEYRAKGLSQSEAAERAGSQAKTKDALGRVGYNIEQEDGIKEYIEYLEHKRATLAMVDSLEIIDKLRETYDMAMGAGKYSDANKATELLATMAGLIGKTSSKNPSVTANNGNSSTTTPKNNVNAFKEEGESADERLKKLSSLIKDVAKD